MRHAFAIGAAAIAWAVVAACSSSGEENNGQQSGPSHASDAAPHDDASLDGEAPVDAGGTTDAAEAGSEEPCDAGMDCPLGCRAGRCLVLTPSNLPPDICDTPGTKDFTGGELPSEPDARIHQVNGPDIFLYKFGNVSGDIRASGNVAIVATQSMRLGSVPSDGYYHFDPAHPGSGKQVAWACGGGGGGHGTPGGPHQTPQGAYTAEAYGSETGIPLLPGAEGATTVDVERTFSTPGGLGGRALQLVSCGTLTITGNVSADGFAPYQGGSGRTAGAGGGSGGTLLIEAASVSVASSGSVTSNGGAGIGGWSGVPGAGGTRTSPPGSSTCGTGELMLDAGFPGLYDLGSGAGGAVGRIRINVRAGTQPELLGNVSPVPSMGTVATHYNGSP
ncbi:hypothetical protein LZC95_11670 [Pendulispora brunnea]|uniref:Uncharacterized protein n=1 Tax=Pendulispora brunnea TaxID=2905690 RepID=A0ABZ2KMA9_9BACT